jgi:tetratricopeptide (TPR) repeat protein
LPAEQQLAEPRGSVSHALAHGARLLASQPALAEAQAAEILKTTPGHPKARLLLGAARRRRGDAAGACEVLRALSLAQPGSAPAQYELALALSAAGEGAASTAALRRAVALDPELAGAWRALADQLRLAGDAAGADAAYAQHIRASVRDPALMAAARALCDERLGEAERLIKAHLKTAPSDVAAIRMLAELATRIGRYRDAEALLAHCLELAPSFTGARHNLAIVLHRQNKAEAALAHIERLLAEDPTDPNYRNLMAAALSLVGEYARAIELYEGVLAERDGEPKVWLSYGHALKTAGRSADAVAAYRRAITLAPGLGEAYWSLANLKTVPFEPAEARAMREVVARPGLSDDDRLHLHYALGKALEDAGDFAPSFGHYAAGAAIRRGQVDYDADETTRQVERTKALFSAAFFAERQGAGCPSDAPIFVVGLPRSGSTLIEQILASHSAVEGTMELPEIVSIARELGGEKGASAYPEGLAELGRPELAALGERYLERTAIQRKAGKPFFIDKMPNNFLHVGLIRLILPNAKIIDARRHPMGAGFSAYKQHFARGQHFSYDLTELGRYWRDYAGLMAHFEAVQPGAVLTVRYEDVVDETEAQVRRLLAFCGLPFEPACLAFHETQRAVRTASSEQVRRPIYREGLDQWRSYAPQLGALRDALGDAVDDYEGRSAGR